MPHFVYILRSLKDDGYYIGETMNVSERLQFHNAGLQRSTRNRIPFEIAHVEELPDRESALKREKQIKSFKGGLALKKLLTRG